ncbi:MAG: respiratory nitrate reductase subunit gamma [Anaerolineae bacterium]
MDRLFQSLSLVPPPWQPFFFMLTVTAGGIFLLGSWSRVSIWLQGRTGSGDVLEDLGALGLLRLSLLKFFSLDCLLSRRVFARSRWRGLKMISIIWGSLILLAGVLLSALGYLFHRPLLNARGHLLASFLLDLGGGLLLLGLLMALARQFIFPPQRWISVAADKLLLTLLTLVVSLGFVMEGLRLAGTGLREAAWWPIGALFAVMLNALLGGNERAWNAIYLAVYLIHAGLAFTLIAYLPFSKLFHLFAAQITTFAASLERERYVEKGKRGILAD